MRLTSVAELALKQEHDNDQLRDVTIAILNHLSTNNSPSVSKQSQDIEVTSQAKAHESMLCCRRDSHSAWLARPQQPPLHHATLERQLLTRCKLHGVDSSTDRHRFSFGYFVSSQNHPLFAF